jgi:signal peptidase II
LETHKESSPKNNNKIRSLFSLFIIAGIILVADQLAKWIVVNNLAPGQSWTPIPGLERIFKFTYITNTGAAFGLFPTSGNFFIIVAIIVSLAIIYYYPSVNNWTVRISLGLQLGGAVSNVWDRIFNGGEVVDYVDIGFWPIFNIADISIVIGVTILAFWLWQIEEQHVKEKA